MSAFALGQLSFKEAEITLFKAIGSEYSALVRPCRSARSEVSRTPSNVMVGLSLWEVWFSLGIWGALVLSHSVSHPALHSRAGMTSSCDFPGQMLERFTVHIRIFPTRIEHMSPALQVGSC